MAERISEKQLSDIWARQALGAHEFATENGVPVTVIYPGRINDRRGGDFCDAVITLGGRTVMGDIELHINSSDWKAHGHHRDANYNRVVLHVVFQNKSSPFTSLQDGTQVPVLALRKTTGPLLHIDPPGNDIAGRLCLNMGKRHGEEAILDILEKAGDARFMEKVEQLKEQLALLEAGQVLYQGIMEALGYSKNRIPFLELARRLPLTILQSSAAGQMTDSSYFDHLYTRLLMTAGLQSGQPPAAENEDIVHGWQMFRARPNNSPVLRIKAMAQLLVRYRRSGLLEGLLGEVKKAPLSGGSQHLEKALFVSQKEFALFITPARSRNLSPLGKSRSGDIIVNILLPFTCAFAQHERDADIGRKSISLYHEHGKLAGNCIERHMAEQLALRPGLISRAIHQQGLLYTYSRFCTRGRCDACSLGQFEVGDNIQVKACRMVTPGPEVSCSSDHGCIVGAE